MTSSNSSALFFPGAELHRNKCIFALQGLHLSGFPGSFTIPQKKKTQVRLDAASSCPFCAARCTCSLDGAKVRTSSFGAGAAPANESSKEPILVGFSTGDSRKYFANPSVVPVLFGMFISWADPIRAALDNTIRTLDAVSAGHCLWQLWRPTIEGFTGLSDHRPMRVP